MGPPNLTSADKSTDFVLPGTVRSGLCPCSGIRHGRGQTLSLVGSGRAVSKFHYTRTHGLCLRPDPTRPTDKEIEWASLRPDKVRGLAGDPSGPWVWSGRVRVVEFRNDTTRPDQGQFSACVRVLSRLHAAANSGGRLDIVDLLLATNRCNADTADVNGAMSAMYTRQLTFLLSSGKLI